MAKLVNVRTSEEHLLTGDVTVIGRLPSSDIRVLEKQVSRRHCRIVRSREGWILADSGSMLGTYLNGEILMRPHCLQPGDEVKVGTEVFTFDKRGSSRREELKLRPLSKASLGDLVPRDATEPRSKLLPVALGGAVAAAAVGALIVVLLLTRQTPRKAVRRAAELLKGREAKELWALVSDERKKGMTFEEFKDQLDALPEGALRALETLEIGAAHREDRGMVVPVAVEVRSKRLTDEVVLFRENGEWRIHTVPTGRLAELAP